MPEHRPGTPEVYATLESFLWWDFRDAADWAGWAHKRGLEADDAAALSSFASASRLQEGLRKLEAANNGAAADPAAADTLNALVNELKLRPRISPLGEVSLSSDHSAVSDAVPALLVMALRAMTEGVWNRFKLCRDASCSASFFDSSKSATKVWCSMDLCGSRNKMRRLRERRRS